ncbi:MAG TPA: hypothetical protein VGJ95_09955, partial [Pseudonocardiaceae bacterium]
FFPWSNIKTLHDGLRLVEAAKHDAALGCSVPRRVQRLQTGTRTGRRPALTFIGRLPETAPSR